MTRLLLLTVLLLLVAAPAASASQVLDRNATEVRLAVDRSGRALVTYRARGKVRRVLVWGAVNARAPGPRGPAGPPQAGLQRRVRRVPAGGPAQYRVTVMGPGVTPDVTWEGPGLLDFDPGNPSDVAHEREMNAIVDRVVAGDALCVKH